MSEPQQPRQEFDLRYPFRTQPDGGPCWCMSNDEPHDGWVHSPLCAEMFRRWWAAEPDPLTVGSPDVEWFQLARDFTYTGPHDPETAHAIVAEHRPLIEAALTIAASFLPDSDAPTPREATLGEALALIARAASNEASRPYSEDGHVIGPNGLTVADWRAINLALYDLPTGAAASTAAAGEGLQWRQALSDLVMDAWQDTTPTDELARADALADRIEVAIRAVPVAREDADAAWDDLRPGEDPEVERVAAALVAERDALSDDYETLVAEHDKCPSTSETPPFDRERFDMETAQLRAGIRKRGEESDNWPDVPPRATSETPRETPLAGPLDLEALSHAVHIGCTRSPGVHDLADGPDNWDRELAQAYAERYASYLAARGSE